MAEFLFEIGYEEIPARMLTAAQAELAQRAEDLLRRERLLDASAVITGYSTPRRLAVHCSGVHARQADLTEELTGPSIKVAYKDGVPTAAAFAFARKAGVEVGELRTISTAKGEYLAATVLRPGRPATEVIAAELPRELNALYWAKSMYWRPGKPERSVRPVRWLLAILEDSGVATIVPVEYAGQAAGTVTYGHRILHGDASVPVARPSDYVSTLESAKVIADPALRRARIRRALDDAARTKPALWWREDESLVETVVHLTEWPSVILGSFDLQYLTLPDEILVTVMRDHQKYFAVEGPNETLAPHFLAVLNTEVDAGGQAIIRHGNERVLRARFNDARFFWDFDQKVTLEERVELLKSVTFQKDLGSYYDKTESNLRIARAIAAVVRANPVSGAADALDVESLETAVRLAKTDLTAELVKEFTELQGIVGGLYARTELKGEAVAQAIYAQYMPASAEDSIPGNIEGQILGLSDRIGTVGDMFAIGLEPTGSKDPFALRRAANGIIKILAESQLPLSLNDLYTVLAATHGPETVTKVRGFLVERVEFYLREVRSFSYDVVKAVLAAGDSDVRDAIARAKAVSDVRATADFAAIAAAFKRVKNILRQAEEKGFSIPAQFDAHFSSEIETQLWQGMQQQIPAYDRLVKDRNYAGALAEIAKLRPRIDAYFEAIMILTDEVTIRGQRLGTIQSLLTAFSRIADFSEIVPG